MNRKLAGGPELSKFLKVASEELDYGWELDVPQTNGKQTVCRLQFLPTLGTSKLADFFGQIGLKLT